MAHQVWKTLKCFLLKVKNKKDGTKKKLEEIKFDEDKDINIFMAELQNTIDELERIDTDFTSSIKVGILNRALYYIIYI